MASGSEAVQYLSLGDWDDAAIRGRMARAIDEALAEEEARRAERDSAFKYQVPWQLKFIYLGMAIASVIALCLALSLWRPGLLPSSIARFMDVVEKPVLNDSWRWAAMNDHRHFMGRGGIPNRWCAPCNGFHGLASNEPVHDIAFTSWFQDRLEHDPESWVFASARDVDDNADRYLRQSDLRLPYWEEDVAKVRYNVTKMDWEAPALLQRKPNLRVDAWQLLQLWWWKCNHLSEGQLGILPMKIPEFRWLFNDNTLWELARPFLSIALRLVAALGLCISVCSAVWERIGYMQEDAAQSTSAMPSVPGAFPTEQGTEEERADQRSGERRSDQSPQEGPADQTLEAGRASHGHREQVTPSYASRVNEWAMSLDNSFEED